MTPWREGGEIKDGDGLEAGGEKEYVTDITAKG